MPQSERQQWAEKMRLRLERRAVRSRPSDQRLAARDLPVVQHPAVPVTLTPTRR